MELESVITGPPSGPPDRQISNDGSYCTTVSSRQSSVCQVREKKVRDRRLERLNTDLLTAVTEHDLPNVIKSLESGACAKATCRPCRVSAVHVAASTGDLKILSVLLANKADVNVRDKLGRTPAHLAAWNGNRCVLKMLYSVDSSIIFSQIEPDKSIDPADDAYDSFSHDHQQILALLPDDLTDGSTPLHLACRRLKVDCVNYLISVGSDINITDSQGLTPLDVAGTSAVYEPLSSISGSQETVTLPQEQVDNITHPHMDHLMRFDSIPITEPQGPLSGLIGFEPIRKGGAPLRSIARKIVTDGGDSLRKKSVAAQESDKPIFQVIKLLIQQGAKMPKVNMKEGSIKKQSKLPITTLHTAVENKDLELIDYLLRNNACMMTWNDDGETPIHLAVRKWLFEPLQKMLHWEGPPVVDVRDVHGRTPLHIAVMQEWPQGVGLLLESKADVTALDNDNETVYHLAAERGNTKLLEEFLSIDSSTKIMEQRNNFYQTALWRAVETNHQECVELLCDAGADPNATLPGDVSLIHMAADNNSPNILSYLLKNNQTESKLKDLRSQEDKGGLTALHKAAKEGFTECVQVLLESGANLSLHTTSHPERGATALHLAGAEGKVEAVQCILNYDPKMLRLTNLDEWYPLHVAAAHGQAKCVKEMLKAGADIAATVPSGKTGLDIIIYCVPRATEFLVEVFDSYIEVNDFPVNDSNCEIKIKYDLLIPLGPDYRELSVLKALLNSGKEKLMEKLLLHPLVETFLELKWQKLRCFFFILMSLNIVFTLSLTLLALTVYVVKADINLGPINGCSRGVLFGSLIPLMLCEILNASQLQRFYLMDYESWVKWTVFSCSCVIGVVDLTYSWAHYLTSITLLLAWIELLFLVARCPNWGFYVLMFSRVATKIFKVLITFTFLLLGFTFSFITLFKASGPFEDLWETSVKVIVMMIEFDYEAIFENIDGTTPLSVFGRGIFIIFVILVAIVLMNLMVGLAVSDISMLETQGRTQRLAKQISFMSLLEIIVYNQSFLKVLPKKLRCIVISRRSVPPETLISPGMPLSIDFNKLPHSVREAVIDKVADQQQLYNTDGVEVTISLQELNYKIERLADVVNRRSSTSSTSSSLTSEAFLESKRVMNKVLRELSELRKDIEELKDK